MKKDKLLNFAITFLLIYLIVGFFTGGKQQDAVPSNDISITTTKNEYDQNETVDVKIKNNTDKLATIKNECPGEPLNVYESKNNNWQEKTNIADLKCEDQKDLVIKPGEEINVSYLSWNHALFNDLGKYKVSATVLLGEAPTAETKNIDSNEFQIKPQGWFGFLWTVAFYQPIYNVLIFLTSTVPYHDLGLAIIILTIIIRTILLIPSQKALKSQRKLQEIQPKINRLKEKYKDNQEMIAKETMALWKENKVNPFGSCLPLLIQFPVLIALFYVIQNGLSPNNTYLLYSGLKGFSLNEVNVNFLGIMNLTQINHFVLPLIVGGLQFVQMKLAIFKKDSKKSDNGKKSETADQMQMANQMMVYMMPVMIALFTASTPAGVGLYWSTTTLYGIIQQLVVNKQVEQENSGVRVIARNAE